MSNVSRSIYQKAVEENKRLIADIKLLVEEGKPSPEKALCINKWREKFSKEEKLKAIQKEAALMYIRNHKEELPDFLTGTIEENGDTE